MRKPPLSPGWGDLLDDKALPYGEGWEGSHVFKLANYTATRKLKKR